MKIRDQKCAVATAMALFLLFSGCGKQDKAASVSRSVVSVNYTYTEEGFFCKDNKINRLEYFDYGQRSYFPVCSRPNCGHDTEECTAVSLDRKAVCVGQLGEKLYYLHPEDRESGAFYSCDMDGGSVQKAADFSKMPNSMYGTVIVFQDDHCFLAAGYDQFDEETHEFLGVTSALYSVDLKGGETKALLPERTERLPAYGLYGLYERSLLFAEWNGEEFLLKVMDLDTGGITMPFGEFAVSKSGRLEGERFVCGVNEEGAEKVKELNLETGEILEIAQMDLLDVYWKEGLKILIDSEERTWQYTEDGEIRLIREGEENRFIPFGGKGELLVGTRNYQDLLYMEKEDFLAGKNNWIVVAEARKDWAALTPGSPHPSAG